MAEKSWMTNKRFWWSVFAVWLVTFLSDWALHGVWLSGWYEQTSQFWRTKEDQGAMMPVMWFGQAVFAWAFVWIYSKGISAGNPWSQAFRYALAMFLVTGLPHQMTMWAMAPYPGELIWRWGFISLIQALACSFAVTWTFQPLKAWKSAHR